MTGNTGTPASVVEVPFGPVVVSLMNCRTAVHTQDPDQLSRFRDGFPPVGHYQCSPGNSCAFELLPIFQIPENTPFTGERMPPDLASVFAATEWLKREAHSNADVVIFAAAPRSIGNRSV